MAIPESRIESLVARCVDAGELGYRDELDRACAEHPDAAPELRQRIGRLEEMGFLGARRFVTGTDWLPDMVGGYRLHGLLGRGGMGIVFRGSKDGGEEVAIKLIRPDLLADARARERFRREALLATRLSHPGICPVLEVGIDDEVPFLVMPLLSGQTFGALVREQTTERRRLLEALEGHARALHAAHEAGLVHRDVTPGNLFVTDDGRAVVLDFGLARDTTGEVATLTMPQELLGTLPYMAPEQIRGDRVDRRTDVYALGVVAFEALAGRLPFIARSRSEMSRLILSGDTPRLVRVATGVSRSLERVVQTAMDLEPSRRYGTAQEFADDLQRLRVGESVAARGVGAILRTRRWAAHHPVASITTLLLALLLAVAGGFLIELTATLREQRASELALESRTLEQADPMRALDKALLGHAEQPSATSLGQLNRLLHQVTMLSTATVLPGPVRRLAVTRIDEQHDMVAVAAESGVSLLRLDRRTGALSHHRDLPVPAPDLLRCVRFSPAGRFVACGGMVSKAFVASVDSGDWTPLGGRKGEIFDVEVDDEGNVHGASFGGQLLFWRAGASEPRPLFDFADFAAQPPFSDYSRNIQGMCAGPGGDLLLWNRHLAVRVRRDGSLVWKTPPAGRGTDVPVAVIDALRECVLLAQLGSIRMLRWSDREVLWTSANRAAPGGAGTGSPTQTPATSCAIAADGTVASVHLDGAVRFWNGGATPFTEYRDPSDQMSLVLGVTGVNAFLAVGRGGTQVRLDTKGRVERGIYGGDIERLGVPGHYAFSTDGSVLVASAGPGLVRTWDFDGSRAAPQWRFVDSPPRGLSPHPDGRQLIVHTDDRRTWLWQPGREASRLDGEQCVFLTRNAAMPGDRIAVGGRLALHPAFAVFDAESAKFRAPVSVPIQNAGVVGVSVLPGDKLLLAIGDSRSAPSRLLIHDIAATEGSIKKEHDWSLPAEAAGQLTSMDASADGRRVVTGDVDGALHVMHLPGDGKPPQVIASARTNGRVWSVDISADGRFVVAGIQDGSVLAWQVDAGPPDPPLVLPRGRGARAFLADNDRLVLEFAHDGILRLWDAKQRPAAVVFEVVAGDGAVVRDAVLMRSGTGEGLAALRLATVASDGWLRVWSLDESSVVKAARERLDALEGRPR